METLLERGIPIDAINEYSAVEKGPGRPPHWEMVFWWTRKPLAGARAVVAASLLPAEAYQTPEQFLNDLFPCRNGRKTVHACNPAPRLVEKMRGKKVLDPFAGFGSIPLEASRLGAEAVAVELLPTAYVFLKAVLEFPRRVKPQDVEKWGRWVVEKLREETKELYDADVYIGTWEVKCPVCGRYTPLVGNWWLAKVKGKEGYERLAWMEWRDGRVEVRDLNEECRKEGGGSCDELKAEVSTRGEEGGSVAWRGLRYAVPLKNVDARRETAQCLHCRAEINHRVVNGKLVKGKKSEGDWYVKWALRQWNANYERYLRGEISLDDLKNSPARPTLLAKVHIENSDLKFQPATPQDVEKLWRAAEELKKMWGDPDIPTEQIPPYGNIGGGLRFPVYAVDKWYQFFNPRQLLTLVKLVKLIREAGRLAEEEKLREGASGEEAKKYAEAVTTYLAIALIRYADYNTVSNLWDTWFLKISHGLTARGIAMMWNWGDLKPETELTGSYSKSIKNVDEATEYLTNISNPPRVVFDDATELSRLEGERFDVVVTDPPYADDVAYAELSDFYYVWLKRALSGVEGGELRPRFLPEAFFDEFGLEIPTQWQRFAPREVSESEGRWEHFGMKVTFADLLSRAFSNVVRFLKEDGLLVVYYVAKKPESWEALVDALWRRGGMTLTAAYPVETEAEESVVARGKASVLGGYVSAWRRRSGERPLELDAAWEGAVTSLVEILKSAGKELYRHQLDFVSDALWLARPRVLLADDVGLGKTIQALLLVKALMEMGRVNHVLVVVPRAVLGQWEEELRRFDVPHFTVENPEFPIGHRVYLVTLDRAKMPEYLDALSRIQWNLVVVDEAHKIRLGTQRQRLSHLCKAAGGCLLLTATPHTGAVVPHSIHKLVQRHGSRRQALVKEIHTPEVPQPLEAAPLHHAALKQRPHHLRYEVSPPPGDVREVLIQPPGLDVGEPRRHPPKPRIRRVLQRRLRPLPPTLNPRAEQLLHLPPQPLVSLLPEEVREVQGEVTQNLINGPDNLAEGHRPLPDAGDVHQPREQFPGVRGKLRPVVPPNHKQVVAPPRHAELQEIHREDGPVHLLQRLLPGVPRRHHPDLTQRLLPGPRDVDRREGASPLPQQAGHLIRHHLPAVLVGKLTHSLPKRIRLVAHKPVDVPIPKPRHVQTHVGHPSQHVPHIHRPHVNPVVGPQHQVVLRRVEHRHREELRQESNKQDMPKDGYGGLPARLLNVLLIQRQEAAPIIGVGPAYDEQIPRLGEVGEGHQLARRRVQIGPGQGTQELPRQLNPGTLRHRLVSQPKQHVEKHRVEWVRILKPPLVLGKSLIPHHPPQRGQIHAGGLDPGPPPKDQGDVLHRVKSHLHVVHPLHHKKRRRRLSRRTRLREKGVGHEEVGPPAFRNHLRKRLKPRHEALPLVEILSLVENHHKRRVPPHHIPQPILRAGIPQLSCHSLRLPVVAENRHVRHPLKGRRLKLNAELRQIPPHTLTTPLTPPIQRNDVQNKGEEMRLARPEESRKQVNLRLPRRQAAQEILHVLPKPRRHVGHLQKRIRPAVKLVLRRRPPVEKEGPIDLVHVNRRADPPLGEKLHKRHIEL